MPVLYCVAFKIVRILWISIIFGTLQWFAWKQLFQAGSAVHMHCFPAAKELSNRHFFYSALEFHPIPSKIFTFTPAIILQAWANVWKMKVFLPNYTTLENAVIYVIEMLFSEYQEYAGTYRERAEKHKFPACTLQSVIVGCFIEPKWSLMKCVCVCVNTVITLIV